MHLLLVISPTAGLAACHASRPATEPRQAPEYYDGYAFTTADTFAIDLWELPYQHVGSVYGNLVNVSTIYGGKQAEFGCVDGQYTDPSNTSQWLAFTGPDVPGSGAPVLQSEVRLFPRNMCSGAGVGPPSFDGVLVNYNGRTMAVSSSGECSSWSGPGGGVDAMGPVARCVMELTPA